MMNNNNSMLINNDHHYKHERLLAFFRDQKFVDCTFKIGKHEIKAHKLILACCSPVFEKMLFGNFASNEINLRDIEVEEFSQMLEFIYAGTVNFSSMFNAWNMFYIGKKYLLENLVELCLGYISENLTMSTLLLSYEYSDLYNLDKIRDQCFRDIIEGVNAIFISDYHMKPSTLKTILKESLLMTKIDLVCKIIDWAIIECEFRNFPLTPENITKILKDEDILKHINKSWLLDIACEYCNNVLIICTCVNELTHKILTFLSSQITWDEDVQIEPFAKSVPLICKSKKIYKIARRIDLQPSEDFISSISVSTEMIVSGLSLCTEMNCLNNYLHEYKGCIIIRFCEQDSDKNVVKPTITNNNVFPYNSQVFVPLRYAVILMPGKIYDIKISYKNFYSERSSIVCSYMSDELVDKRRGYAKIYFYDFYGTVIKGIAYYPV